MNAPQKEIFFSYVATFGALEIGAISDEYQLVSESDSLFEIKSQQRMIKADVLDDTPNIYAGNQFPGLMCTIYDTQVGRFITNGKTPVTNIFGTSQYPNILPRPHWLMRRSVLLIKLYNDSEFDLTEAQLVFTGIKHTVQGE